LEAKTKWADFRRNASGVFHASTDHSFRRDYHPRCRRAAMTAAIHNGIKLPPALQALRGEIRVLDRYMRGGRLSQLECDARLDEWRIKYPPGMDRYDKLAILAVWEDDMAGEIVARGWKAADEKRQKTAVKRPKEYRPAQSTIDAFWYLVRLKEPDRLAAWLDDHPREKSYLLKLLENSNADR
jgi:hypothetical protein